MRDLFGKHLVTKPLQPEELLARVTPHLALRQLQHELESHGFHAEAPVREKVREICNSNLTTILTLSKLAESRDDETARHIERTRIFCRVMAEELLNTRRYSEELSEAFVETIFQVSPLHDIGKVGIPDRVLLKPGRLTPEEFEIMKAHVLIGSKTMEAIRERYPRNAFINMGFALARSHHERWDGRGYPDSLSGESIPLSARIMAVADVYDALRSKRPYKEAYSHAQSCGIILEGAGKHFDPVVVNAFEAREADLADTYQRMGASWVKTADLGAEGSRP